MKNIFYILSFLVFVCTGILSPQEYRAILRLEGQWKFQLGDNMKYANYSFNDSKWDEIKVPSAWEDQGYNGYDGYAWYRKHFTYKYDSKGRSLYLQLGNIDDVDMVYVNGKPVGYTGSFPPFYQTAYSANRRYPVPEHYLNKNGDNVIAVRVFDKELSGGILRGDIGLYVLTVSAYLDINLEGDWKFTTGDNHSYSNRYYDDSRWRNLYVPGFWDYQGLDAYNGFGWYRKAFYAGDNLKGKKLVLLMGKIDDLDQVYVNGRLVGQTGRMGNNWASMDNESYQKFRVYYIPNDVIQYNQNNTIAVRVYDGFVMGGIYEAPVGFMTAERWARINRAQKNHSRTLWDLIFGD